jgi:hypothetical protein
LNIAQARLKCKNAARIFINLTPCVPLSTLGEGEEKKKEGLTPLLDSF